MICSVLILQLEFDSLIQLGHTTWQGKRVVQTSLYLYVAVMKISVCFLRACACVVVIMT
jgi:hypothetical protein